MRTAVTIGLVAGSEVWEFLSGPETPLPDQRAAFKALRSQRHHERYAEVQLWESSGGIVLRNRFLPASPVATPAPSPSTALPPPEPEEPPVSSGPPEVEPDADFAVPDPTNTSAPKPGNGRRRNR